MLLLVRCPNRGSCLLSKVWPVRIQWFMLFGYQIIQFFRYYLMRVETIFSVLLKLYLVMVISFGVLKRTLAVVLIGAFFAMSAFTVACESDEPDDTNIPTSDPVVDPVVEPPTTTPTGATLMVPPTLDEIQWSPSPAGSGYDHAKTYYAQFDTQRGVFTVVLYDDETPNIVENFINLARAGYYDNTVFHRVIPGFIAQGGDPTATGAGGPVLNEDGTYSFAMGDESYRIDDEFHVSRRHNAAGILSMANSGPNTNGSQFFVTLAATPHLDAYNADDTPKNCVPGISCHAVFGRVIDSLNTVYAIQEPSAPGTGDALNSVTIFESDLPTYEDQYKEIAESVSGFDASKTYYARFTVQNPAGDLTFTVRLDSQEAPSTVETFLNIARGGYYNDTYFYHTPNVAVLGGGPTQTGVTVPFQYTTDEYSDNLRHDSAGVISVPGTSSSFPTQFLITRDLIPGLDGRDKTPEECLNNGVGACFSAFGRIVNGMEALYRLSFANIEDPNFPGDQITSVTVFED